jgi:protein-S-isoprenylcysteine O-methyltransferase Ste14
MRTFSRGATLQNLWAMTFLKWVSRSLIGQVVLCQTMFSASLLALFLGLNYEQGTLTASWALWILIVTVFAGILAAILLWHTMTLPLIKRQQRGEDTDR